MTRVLWFLVRWASAFTSKGANVGEQIPKFIFIEAASGSFQGHCYKRGAPFHLHDLGINGNMQLSNMFDKFFPI